MFQKIYAAFSGVFLLLVSGAFAADGPLTEDQAKRFVASLPAVDTLGDEWQAEGKTEQLMVDTAPKAGEGFKPYSSATAALAKNYPSDHAQLAKTVKGHGFSIEDWGVVGDRVMAAYIAIKLEEADPQAMAMMEGMDTSMLEMMPPEMRAELERSFAMMETAKNASDADKQAVATVKAELDAYTERGE